MTPEMQRMKELAKDMPWNQNPPKRADAAPPPLTAKDEADIREAIDERAAIMEFDAGQPRHVAEQEGCKTLRVFRYKLKDRPPCDPSGTGWCTAILSGFNLEAAQTHLEGIYGADRVLTVVEHRQECPA